MKKGKFIVFYGTNNLGKTTQAKLLVEHLIAANYPSKYLKYPTYDLEPSGVMLDEYLRKGNPYELSPREAQILYAFNRFQYEPILKLDLEKGINIVAEDYLGTGIAWGMGAGVDKNFLMRINSQLYPEGLAFLFHGTRFQSGLEALHLHENNRALTDKVAQIHLDLAVEFGWIKIDANRPVEEISKGIWEKVKTILN